MFSAKNRSKKYQIIEKCDNFENQPSCKGYGPCKGNRLCKMLSLGQKLKMPKTCKNYSPRTLQVVSAKTAGKNIKYSRNETILKISHFAKAIAHAKVIAFAKCSVWVKN